MGGEGNNTSSSTRRREAIKGWERRIQRWIMTEGLPLKNTLRTQHKAMGNSGKGQKEKN